MCRDEDPLLSPYDQYFFFHLQKNVLCTFILVYYGRSFERFLDFTLDEEFFKLTISVKSNVKRAHSRRQFFSNSKMGLQTRRYFGNFFFVVGFMEGKLFSLPHVRAVS